jgi:large repetitive protein
MSSKLPHLLFFRTKNGLSMLFAFAFLLSAATQSLAQAIPQAINVATCAGSPARLNVTNTPTAGYRFEWYKDLALTNLQGVGNTYLTDPITATTNFYVVESNGTTKSGVRTVTVTANPVPAVPVVAPAAACYGQSTTVTATPVLGATIAWATLPTGVAPFSTSAMFTTAPLSTSATYYVTQELNGCTSSPKAVTVLVNALPITPTVTNTIICDNTVAVFAAGATTATTEWYDGIGNKIFTGAAYTTPAPLTAVQTYYVYNISAQNCKSAVKAVTAFTRTAPTPITLAPVAVCKGSAATFTPIGGNGATEWRSGSANGPLVFTGNSFTTPVLNADITYFATPNNAGCKGTTQSALATVKDVPAPPTVARVSACAGSSAVLTATALPGASVSWYLEPTANTLLSNSTTYTTTPLTQTAYLYAKQTVDGCSSATQFVTVGINPLPATPVFGSNPTICAGKAVNLSLANGSSTTQWFNTLPNAGTTPIFTGANYASPEALGITTIFYTQNVNTTTGCKSEVSSQVVTVLPAPIISANSEYTIRYGETVELKATGGFLYSWSPSEYLDNPNIAAPTTNEKLPLGSTLFLVTGANADGCLGTARIIVNVIPDFSAGSIPNIITPNNDGVNDEWLLPFLYKFDSPYTLKIYARGGNEVYSTTNYDQKWAAKLNGADLPDDTYWYVLVIDGNKKDYRGFITVRR